ncbi:hypothetical protein BDZ45DRAFT_274027 [Acephala macrosclerotiorum]|nr:hypothetical protein BDZ45DRAFT_274027 [Acephala macrosclerotiorum]
MTLKKWETQLARVAYPSSTALLASGALLHNSTSFSSQNRNWPSHTSRMPLQPHPRSYFYPCLLDTLSQPMELVDIGTPHSLIGAPASSSIQHQHHDLKNPIFR